MKTRLGVVETEIDFIGKKVKQIDLGDCVVEGPRFL